MVRPVPVRQRVPGPWRFFAPLTRLGCAAAAAIGFLCATPFVSTAAASGLPPQGLYEECEPVDQAQCASELSQMGGAGFQLALNYSAWYGDAAAIQAYASEAQAAGIKVIWPLDFSAWRDPGTATSLPSTYTMLAPDCGCSDNSGFLQYVINLVRNLPATWGYYIGDELDPSQASADAALASQVRSLDPSHQLLYIGMGSAATTGNLQPFESVANVVGADIYPIGGGGTAQSVAPVASAVEQLSQQNRTAPAMVLQAFDWSEYPATPSSDPTWPTESEMQQMRDEALAINPSMILWYSIYDVLRSDNPAGHWQDLVTAAFAPEPSAAADSGSQSSGSAGPVIASVASVKHRHHRRRHRHRHRRHHRHHRRRGHHRRTQHHRRPHRAADQPHGADRLLGAADRLLPSLETLLIF